MLQLIFPFSPRVNRDIEYVLTFDSVNKKNKRQHSNLFTTYFCKVQDVCFPVFDKITFLIFL